MILLSAKRLVDVAFLAFRLSRRMAYRLTVALLAFSLLLLVFLFRFDSAHLGSSS